MAGGLEGVIFELTLILKYIFSPSFASEITFFVLFRLQQEEYYLHRNGISSVAME